MRYTTLASIGALLIIVIVLIFKNIDGAAIASITALIAGLGGYSIAKLIK